ncbi:GBS Bsp-like repeat-containing protein [Streptococcus ferus]|uniref:GBS Bsp-like repeat-containing protein n=1 Tax=Streptococcus ferus TaxID=1345 RepID=UPI0023524E48|nr:GBS Bsp-like repeat-containing protein [Streptococcus ferus]
MTKKKIRFRKNNIYTLCGLILVSFLMSTASVSADEADQLVDGGQTSQDFIGVSETTAVSSAPDVTSTENTLSKQDDSSSQEVSSPETAAVTVSEAKTSAPELAVTQTGSQLKITYDGELPQGSSVKVAVWTEEQQQDDLRWYTADSHQQLTIDLSKTHKAYGLYNIHAYNELQGKMIGLKAVQYTIKLVEPAVTIKKRQDDCYDVEISNVGKEITSLSLPVWTEHKGQDDILWYTATKAEEGRFLARIQLKNHRYETGLYQVHVYGQSSISGKMEGLKATHFDIPETKVTISTAAKGDSGFSVKVTGQPTYISEILLPTWTQNKDQDDISWYTAKKQPDGSFLWEVSISNHHFETGLYQIHAYGKAAGDGRLIALGSTSYDVPSLQVNVDVSDKGNNVLEVTITDVPSYIKEVMVPIWSVKNDQDDISWYKASDIKDGRYQLQFSLANHKYNIGDYAIHVYGKTSTNKMLGLTSTQYHVSDVVISVPAKFSVGQTIQIQAYATHESNGYSLSNHQGWIGSVINIAKNTNNAIGGWEYHVTYNNGEQNVHVLEQDLRYVHHVALKEYNTKIQNNIALQEAFRYASSHPDITLYLPQGRFMIGSDIQEEDLGRTDQSNYIILSSNTQLRGHDKGTRLIVDGTMLWFGLPTGPRGIDGLSNFVMDNVHIVANDLVQGNYFMLMANHGNNWLIKNSSFTMVQKMGRHIFDLGGVQNAVFTNNQFIGYAPNLTGVTRLPDGANLHDYYAEAIQLDRSNNQGGWDASMIKRLDSNYMAYNAMDQMSSNITIDRNQFLPYYNAEGKLVAYSATLGQHSSEVGDVIITNNRFVATLAKRYSKQNNSWFMQPIHFVLRKGAQSRVTGNQIQA